MERNERGGDGGDGHVEEVLRHSRTIRNETEALFGELRSTVDGVNRALDLQGRMERHPYATMAAMAGVGYVLGGGLFTRFSARILHFGTRAVLLPLIRSELGALGEAALGKAGAAAASGGSEDGSGGM